MTWTMTSTGSISARLARAAAIPALVSALAATGACRDHSAEPAARAAASPPAAAPASLDPRTQYDFSRALAEVEGGDRDSASAGYAELRSSWLGRRYRWRVYVLEPLCRSRDACNVLAFDRAGRDRDIVHGWMPRLDLDEGAFAAIQRACTDRARGCQIAVEGTLTRLVADTENPTSLEFSGVRVP